MNELFYIYKITNNIDGKTYIGQRKYTDGSYTDDYKSLISDGYWGSGTKIKEAIKKLGVQNFTKDILVSHLEYKEATDEAERYFIKCYRELGKAEYNIADGGFSGGNYGPEWLKLVSEGTKAAMANPEVRKKISEKTKAAMTPEVRKNISDGMTADGRKRISEAMSNREITEDFKNKISKAHKGRHYYNNGIIEVRRFECPEGFTPGRLKR